jgi:putative transposase
MRETDQAMVAVRELRGLGSCPSDRTSASNWCKRHGIETHWQVAKGGRTEFVRVPDLPEDVRRAYTLKLLSDLDLDPGTYDEEAQARLIEATPTMRAEAERKAEVMRCLIAGRKRGLGRSAVHRAVWDRFGTEGNSAKSLDRWEEQVRGVDPVNFAPALLDWLQGRRAARRHVGRGMEPGGR